MGTKRLAKRYTLEEKERGLLAIALYDGNYRAAARDLKARGTPIPKDTLRSWKDANAEKLAEIRRELLPKIRERQAAECEETATLAGEVERDGLERLRGEMLELPLRDLAGAVRNVSVTKGISLENAGKLRGDPTAIVEYRSGRADEILNQLRNLGLEVTEADIIDSTARDVTDVESVERAGTSFTPTGAQATRTREDHELPPTGS